MTKTKREVLIWLDSAPEIGPHTMRHLQQASKDQHIPLEEVYKSPDSAGKELGLSFSQQESLQNFKKQFSIQNYQEFLAEKNTQVILADEMAYPQLLLHIDTAPFALFYQGPTQWWNDLAIAVIGTRKMTIYGEEVTRTITRELVEAGVIIVSGFMYGVDMCAHQTALEGEGKSIAVLGYGFDQFPNRKVTEQALTFKVAGNVLMSEYPPFMPPKKGNFPARNRIVAGLSQAVVVTEAADRSGSLITSNYAVNYGRLVCAVPGPFNHAYSQGTKDLVNQGAVLVTSGLDVLSELQPSLVGKNPSISYNSKSSTSSIEKKEYLRSQVKHPTDLEIIRILGSSSLDLEQMCEHLRLPLSEVMSRVSLLEIAGVLDRRGDKWWSFL